MNKKKVVGMVLLGMLTAVPAYAQVTSNVPVDSRYYDTVEKLSGMGYLESLPNGAKPYSRAQMAKWVLEADAKAETKPMPKYLASEVNALKHYLSPEIAVLNGEKGQDDLKLREAKVGFAYNHSDDFTRSYPRTSGTWAPFGANHNGHKYGRNGNVYGLVDISGNIGHDTAVAFRGRASWDKDNDGTASLEEGYIKTRTGAWAWEAGRQAMMWGEGASGHLLLGNNMKPLTTVQAHLNEPIQAGGFLKFLGQVDFHAFYGRLDGDRRSDASHSGLKDYDDAGLLGLRLDITPANWFTLGASRVSMLGGDHNGLSSSSWGKWFTGKNANHDDKWDDIAGFDFRLRLPGVQFYGELMGEDQAHAFPSDWGYRGGMYLPQLTKDGSWDMLLEAAYTNDDWYRHGTYQDGWTYSGDIMGDAMGTDARKYYARVNHYLPGDTKLGLYFQRTEMQRGLNGPTVEEMGLTGHTKLSGNMFLDGLLGYARVKQSAKDHTVFAGAEVGWEF